ncbi:hypothetical protein ACI7RC_10505 [Brevibacillus sp. B_LB10_24]|uniref:hypothetical protein n=1 Tax=Brevibacillus sp. B_LB10_24 TaxID=3380645 RepID=UPI0038BC11A0
MRSLALVNIVVRKKKMGSLVRGTPAGKLGVAVSTTKSGTSTKKDCRYFNVGFGRQACAAFFRYDWVGVPRPALAPFFSSVS